MKIDHEFRVSVPLDRAWAALTDLVALAPCMPGAHLTGVEGEDHKGRVRVEVGPVVSQFAGVARFVERDEATRTAVIRAAGKDTRGAGTASATVHATPAAVGEGTVVTVSTDLSISGRPAQFGSGMIKEVSQKLFAQFVANVETRLLTDPEAEPTEAVAEAVTEAAVTDAAVRPVAAEPTAVAEAQAASPAPVAEPAAGAARAAASTAPPAAAAPRTTAPAPLPTPVDDDEPLDLMKPAGSSVCKRLVPVAVGAVVVGVVVRLRVR